MCKSYLKLAKEFQGRSYDMMVAHRTIIFSRYIMLTVENRNNTNFRIIGALFYYCCDERWNSKGALLRIKPYYLLCLLYDVELIKETNYMVTVHKSKKRIINIIEIGVAICIFVCVFLFRERKYWAPEKGEYGTRKISNIEMLKENPNKLWQYIIVLIAVAVVSIVFIFLKKKFIKDWLK